MPHRTAGVCACYDGLIAKSIGSSVRERLASSSENSNDARASPCKSPTHDRSVPRRSSQSSESSKCFQGVVGGENKSQKAGACMGAYFLHVLYKSICRARPTFFHLRPLLPPTSSSLLARLAGRSEILLKTFASHIRS